MTPLWVVGAGGHAKEVIDAARASQLYDVIGVLDDNPGRHRTTVLEVPVLGEASPVVVGHLQVKHAIIAVGENRDRAAIARRLDALVTWVSVVHPAAYLGERVYVGDGTAIMAGVVILPDTVVGAHAILNTSCSVSHDGVIGDLVHVAPGARLAGSVHVETGAFIGMGANILPKRRIGAWATIGAGAVVVRDVAAGVTAMGVPARVSVFQR